MKIDGCQCEIGPVSAGLETSNSLEGVILLAARPFPGLPSIHFTSLGGFLAVRAQNGWIDIQRRCNQMVAELQPEWGGAAGWDWRGMLHRE